jgi:hypothetical protein
MSQLLERVKEFLEVGRELECELGWEVGYELGYEVREVCCGWSTGTPG